MGNKQTRRRSYSDAGQDVGQPRRKPRRSQSASQFSQQEKRSGKTTELGGAVPYAAPGDMDINVKVYHSYGDLARPKSSNMDQSDFKVYRKSAIESENYASLPYRRHGEGLQKYASLPRHFGRSLPHDTSDYPEMMPRKQDSSEDVPDFHPLRPESDRTSKRVSTGSSLSLSKAPVSLEDFPSTSVIQRKLKCFEEQFCRSLVDKHAGLPDTLQLSSLAIVLCRVQDGTYRHISLLEIMEGGAVPTQNTILIPPVQYNEVLQMSKEQTSNTEAWKILARDLVMFIGVEAASEISRMFEYQISLLAGESAVRVLADYAAVCALEYIKKHSLYLDRNTATMGVVQNNPGHESTGSIRYLSAIIGYRELKWQVQHLFTKTALRKELCLDRSEMEDADGLCISHYYYTHPDCDPQLYGYRGQLLEWDWLNRSYKVNENDDKMFSENITDPITYPDDFHRMYSPYKMLFGLEVMTKYSILRSKKQTDQSMAQFLIDLTCGTRDGVQPIYRPLKFPRKYIDFNCMNLKNVDLTRAQLGNTDLSKTNMTNCNLLLADINESMDSSRQLEGNNVSYTNLVPSTLDQASLDAVKGQPIVFVRPKPKKKKKPRVTSQPDDQDQNIDLKAVTTPAEEISVEITPVTTKPRKKKRKNPKTLNMVPEVENVTKSSPTIETSIDDKPPLAVDGNSKEHVKGGVITENLPESNIDHEDILQEKQLKVSQPKQKKPAKGKKKVKKRQMEQVSPAEQVSPIEHDAPTPHIAPCDRTDVPSIMVTDEQAVTEHFQSKPAESSTPTQVSESTDPTVEFFKESQLQYQPEDRQIPQTQLSYEDDVFHETAPDRANHHVDKTSDMKKVADGTTVATESNKVTRRNGEEKPKAKKKKVPTATLR